MKTFKITSAGPDGIHHPVVKGDAVTIGTLECFVFYDPDFDYEGEELEGWNVSELETGMMVASDYDKAGAIERAEQKYMKHPEALEKARQMLIEKGVVLPVNPCGGKNVL